MNRAALGKLIWSLRGAIEIGAQAGMPVLLKS